MRVDEVGERLRGEQHDAHRNHDRSHHHRQMVHHAYRRDHGIQREDGVQHHNLRHHDPEAGVAFAVAVIMLAVFQPLMEFCRGLEQQEQTTEQHDQITAGEA